MSSLSYPSSFSSCSSLLKPQFSWCCTGEFIQEGSSRTLAIHRIAGYDDSGSGGNNDQPASCNCKHPSGAADASSGGGPSDLTKSSDWMECVEGEADEDGASGGTCRSAYDTLRCDWVLHAKDQQQKQQTAGAVEITMSNGKNKESDKGCHHCDESQPKSQWKIWGLDYHLERLQHSFQELHSMMVTKKNSNGIAVEAVPTEVMDQAVEQSRRLFDALLHEATKSTLLSEFRHSGALQEKEVTKNRPNSSSDPACDDAVWIQLIRFTWLWTLETNDNNNSTGMIRVRGHACSSAQPINVFQSKTPIVASLALSWDSQTNQFEVDPTLPKRHNENPQVKLTEWTRQRKQWEHLHARYKTTQQSSQAPISNGDNTALAEKIGEVLLVLPSSNGIQLLEGLSSNVFVVYKDGSLKTASSQVVLPGYARHLVLIASGSSEQVLLPILLQDVDQWEEVFITSSSRLILPVHKIVVPTETGWIEFWKQRSAPGTCGDAAIPKWQQLEHELLRLGGYGR